MTYVLLGTATKEDKAAFRKVLQQILYLDKAPPETSTYDRELLEIRGLGRAFRAAKKLSVPIAVKDQNPKQLTPRETALLIRSICAAFNEKR